MGFLNRLFTGKTGDLKHVRLLAEGFKELQGELAGLRAQLERLADAHEELKSEHRKLRGRFYAARGEVEARPETREQMKLSTLSRIGYIPGQPAPHRG